MWQADLETMMVVQRLQLIFRDGTSYISQIHMEKSIIGEKKKSR